MAPSPLLLARQFGGPPGNRGDGNGPAVLSIWAIIGILVAVLIVALIIGTLVVKYRRRTSNLSRTSGAGINLSSTTPPKTTYAPPAGKPNSYGSSYGYQSTADQNQGLLSNAEAPGISITDADHTGVGSTQNGFGFINANLAAGIQRPASVATFSAPPPRYEEAAAAGSAGLVSSGPSSPPNIGSRPTPQGEAASYYNAGAGTGEERGRSATRGAQERRNLSADDRGDRDRRRSISRFREEGMLDAVDTKS